MVSSCWGSGPLIESRPSTIRVRRNMSMRTVTFLSLLALITGCDTKSSPPAPAAPGGTSSATAAPAAASAATPQGEQTFYFGVRESHTNITFQSKNDLTDILGASHTVTGSATIDFGAGTGRCELSVPAASLNSGMADRDRAMMGSTWLDVKKYPMIEFRGEKAANTDKPTAGPWRASSPCTE